MRESVIVLAALGAVSLFVSSGFGDAMVTVTDIGSDDVAGLSQPIRAFPVPAAAGWAGPAYLIYDNYAEGLQFSASELYADFWWTQPPFSNADINIQGLSHDYAYGAPGGIAIDNNKSYFTNEEGSELDAPEGTPPPDKRWPYHIPRPGRYCGEDFSCLYFDLAQDAYQFGVFLPYHSNTWSSTPGQEWDDHNYNPNWNQYHVWVHAPGEDWTTAEYHLMDMGNGYCPFLMVQDTDPISAVTIIHNAGYQGYPTFGFMDVYSDVPEPATMGLIVIGAAGLLLRRRR
jgi:hypothetical protein